MRKKCKLMEELDQILSAKEKRTELREKISEKYSISISLTLNIPGFPKSNEAIHSFFNLILSEFKNHLIANRIIFQDSNIEQFVDAAGDFFIVYFDNEFFLQQKLKSICESFEINHAVGRLIDVDVFSYHGFVNSDKQKKCFLCDNTAFACIRSGNHAINELRDFALSKIEMYLRHSKRDTITKRLAALAINSILLEVSLSPKPGLVDKLNNGAHTDMDYQLFLDSTSVIAPFFVDVAKAGFDYSYQNLDNALPEIRKIGLMMETAMFQATKGVNTQKGIVFLLSLAVFSSARIIAQKNEFRLIDFQTTIKLICRELSFELLDNRNYEKTHGQIAFEKFGKFGAGARFEAENGFPVVCAALRSIPHSFEFNTENLVLLLLKIMSLNNDSNILYRGDLEVLNFVKVSSLKILNEKDAAKRWVEYMKLINYCLVQNISPGGSADLLVIAIFLKKLLNEFYPSQINIPT